MGLGAVGVKAQVRIGGNTVPNPAAVLDLNATDATTGTKGLALPRVSLSSNTVQLTSGVTNLTGMLVYNTNASITGGAGTGIYYWDGSNWLATLHASPADQVVLFKLALDTTLMFPATTGGWFAFQFATSRQVYGICMGPQHAELQPGVLNVIGYQGAYPSALARFLCYTPL